MSTMTFGYYQNTKMGGAVIIAIALHLVIVWLFLHNDAQQSWDDFTPPPSVVMELSMEAEAKQVTEVNIGQIQEVSVASKAQQATPEESQLPSLPTNEQAELLVTKTEKQRSQPLPKKRGESSQKSQSKLLKAITHVQVSRPLQVMPLHSKRQTELLLT
ncbi:hypothetical protein AB6G19_10950 [Providencia manganoxydans]